MLDAMILRGFAPRSQDVYGVQPYACHSTTAEVLTY